MGCPGLLVMLISGKVTLFTKLKALLKDIHNHMGVERATINLN